MAISLKISCDNWLVVFGVMVAILLRCATMLHSYSGQGKSPMYGDYEAQRHWMEITMNLPIEEWYRNSTRNDLQYWGLDYPPLTAYHMYICGKIARFINPSYVELFKSRGFESDQHKLFMRLTVLIVDILIYIPSLIFYYSNIKSTLPFSLNVVLSVLYPGIILIDHGHFQYNCASLGLLAISVTLLLKQKHVLASIFFCLALNYKQMELYHSLPYFFYLLSICVPKPGQSASTGFIRLAIIGTTVLGTFALIWFPFIRNIETSMQVLNRQFPFGRGIFEDKVSNFWCLFNVFYKLKSCDIYRLMRICLLTTMCAILPSSIDLFLRPNVKKFVLSLINSSLAFFLFSYQVHEKTILVVALPVLLHLPGDPLVCFWFLSVSTFSMVPLFIKDGLMVAYCSLSIFYTVTFYTAFNELFTKKYKFFDQIANDRKFLYQVVFFSIVALSLIGCCLLTLFSVTLEPPKRYPDLFPLLVSAYSCVHFLGFFVYFNIRQIQIPQEFYDINNIKIKEH